MLWRNLRWKILAHNLAVSPFIIVKRIFAKFYQNRTKISALNWYKQTQVYLCINVFSKNISNVEKDLSQLKYFNDFFCHWIYKFQKFKLKVLGNEVFKSISFFLSSITYAEDIRFCYLIEITTKASDIKNKYLR